VQGTALDELVQNPDLARSCDEIREGYFRRNVGSHVIFFRKAGDRFDIVRILHGRRNFRRHLPKR
jgi:toxin ParE1/3/4